LTLILVPFTAFAAFFFFPVFFLVVGFLYRWITIAFGSATLGMRLCAIELRDREGMRLDGLTAGLHTLIYSISFGSAVLHIISIVLMLTSERNQGLPDTLLGTVAINRAARS